MIAVLVGAGALVALAPLHVWLARMPAIGDGLLVIAVATKVGLYALIRIAFELAAPHSTMAALIVIAVGGLTIAAGCLMILQSDLSRMLTYATMQMGGMTTIVIGLALLFQAHDQVDATVFASLVFSYFYLWTVTPATWPPPGTPLPAIEWPMAAALGWLASR